MRGNPGNLRQAAAAKSAAAKARAENGLTQISRNGDPITFRSLARIAGVSLDFLYRTPEIRRRAEHLRAQQNARPSPPRIPADPDQPGSEWIKFLEEIDKQVPRLTVSAYEPGGEPHVLGNPHHRRQLRDAKDASCPAMAGQAPPVPHSLHADQFVLAEPGSATRGRM